MNCEVRCPKCGTTSTINTEEPITSLSLMCPNCQKLSVLEFGALRNCKEESKADMVNHPPHYTQGGIECIDAMEAMMTKEEFIGYLRGSVFKYQWRVRHKNGLQDLQKCEWYLKKLQSKLNEIEKDKNV